MSKGENIKLTIESLDKYAVLENNQTNIGIINTDAERDVDFNLTLTNENPWFNGYLRILVRFEGGGYNNYQMLKIPIKIVSTNKWTRDQASLSNIYPEFKQGRAFSAAGAWYAITTPYSNYGAGYLRQTGAAQFTFGTFNAAEATYVNAVSNAKAAFGVYLNSQAKVNFTTNSGSSWTEKSIPGGYVFGIAFFGEQEGVYLSNPEGGKWSIMTSSTAWDNFTAVSEPVPAEIGEKSHQKAFSYYDYNVWFGSNKGNVYLSKDKGYTWKAVKLTFAENIEHLIFADNNKGAAIFQRAGETENQRLALTTDGGNTWADANIDLSASHPKIVSSFTLFNSGIFYFVCEEGTVFGINPNDLKKTMILNTRDRKVQYAAAYASSPDIGTLFFANNEISKLTFNYEILNGNREILCLDGKEIDFDTLELTKNKSKFLKIKNIGNVAVTIDSIVVIDGNNTVSGEFSLLTAKPESIDAGATINLRVKYMPSTIGDKSAVLRIYNNGEPSQYDIALIGFAKSLPNEHKLTFADPNQALLGNVIVGKESINKLTIANLSNLEITIDSITFTPYSSTLLEEFYVTGNWKKTLSPIEIYDLDVIVKASSEGKKSSLIKIYNTGDLNPIQILLDATAQNPASVSYNKVNNARVYPQPAADEINIDFPSGSRPISIELLDINGQIIYVQQGVNAEENIKISTKNIPSGTYIILLKYENFTEYNNIIIQK